MLNMKEENKKLHQAFGVDIPIYEIEKDNTPTSRAARLDEAKSQVDDTKSTIEELTDELQEWYDNLPENFQNGEKGESLQSAIDALEQIQSDLESIDMDNVEFPGMFG